MDYNKNRRCQWQRLFLLSCLFHSLEHMGRQHRGGHGPHSAGHRRHCAYDLVGGSKIHITHQIAVLIHIDAHVQHQLAGGQMIPAYHIGPSGGGDEHLRPTALGGQVGGTGVAEGDGGVFSPAAA